MQQLSENRSMFGGSAFDWGSLQLCFPICLSAFPSYCCSNEEVSQRSCLATVGTDSFLLNYNVYLIGGRNKHRTKVHLCMYLCSSGRNSSSSVVFPPVMGVWGVSGEGAAVSCALPV